MGDQALCHAARLTPDSISDLNRSPLAFLAECGVRHGQPFGRSFIHAQDLLDRYGTSRRIELEQAQRLCRAMRMWAEERRPPARG